jgi:hypothetical protein
MARRVSLVVLFLAIMSMLASKIVAAPLPARQSTEPRPSGGQAARPWLRLAARIIIADSNELIVLPASEMLMRAVRTVALEQQLLDKREIPYVFCRPQEWEQDLSLIKRRYTQLKDAPPVEDCARFPDRTLVAELLAFNLKYRQQLEVDQRLDLVNTEWYQSALSETDALYRIWDTVRDSRTEYYYISVRREALNKLRSEVGVEAYYSGKLPPHVPVWRFKRID